MAKTKYMTYDCAYCRKTTKMELVGEVQAEEGQEPAVKAWYRCTRCKHTALIDKPMSALMKKGEAAKKIDRTACLTYSREQVYKVGQAIYHTEWDDVGKVTAKQKTSDGTQSITVSFEKLGERRLIENMQQTLESGIIESVPVQA
jgi:DNA-directed RNA polymerase subunit RPC12/RpoP